MAEKITFLGIETSCDETAAAVIRENDKGTADILNARPTNIKTIAKIAPVFLISIFKLISSKFVDPVNPYRREHPYSRSPEDKALNTKYFTPDSFDFKLSLSIEASI